MTKKQNVMISGKAIDMDTGKVIHKTKSNSVPEFEEFFTKPMKKKLS